MKKSKPKQSYATAQRIGTEERRNRLDKYRSDQFNRAIRKHARTLA